MNLHLPELKPFQVPDLWKLDHQSAEEWSSEDGDFYDGEREVIVRNPTTKKKVKITNKEIFQTLLFMYFI